MGTRVKVFESTGLAPNGRLYAGDLNAIQDHYADQANFSQEVDAAAFGIGEAALKLLRYGTGEARLSGALRTDGIVRGLGGLYPGAFTTAQRDAIPAGSRPYGLQILNTTTNQYEWNKGTDAAPVWGPISPSVWEVPIGSVMDWPWAAAQIPAGAILPYGQTISRTTYAALHNLAQLAGYPYGNGDGATTFGIIDMRGRVNAGKDDMGGAAAGRLTLAISGVAGATLGGAGGSEGITLTTGQIPAHNHGVNESPHSHTLTDPGHAHNVNDPGHFHTATDSGHAHGVTDPGHNHNVNDPQHSHSIPLISSGAHVDAVQAAWSADPVIGAINSGSAPTGITIASHVAGVSIQNGSAVITVASKTTGVTLATAAAGITLAAASTGISTQNAGGGAVHVNTQPTIVVNKLMRAL
jgi:microcystin-dependent protein